jgi:hypothetical protein
MAHPKISHYRKPLIQPLPDIRVKDLLPEIVDWLASTPDSAARRQQITDLVRNYNANVDRFAQKTGKVYLNRTRFAIKYWLRDYPKQAIPHLDELYILAQSYGISPVLVQQRYLARVNELTSATLEAF